MAATLIALLLAPAMAGLETVSVDFRDEPADRLLTSLDALGSWTFRLDADLLAEDRHRRRLDLAGTDLGHAAIAQAIATRLQCWWYQDPQGVIRFTTRDALPPQGPLEVISTTTRLPPLESLGARVRGWLAPWLGGHAGVEHQPRMNAWAASLDAAGRERLLALLSQMEQPRPVVPPLVDQAEQPAPGQALSDTLQAADWPRLAHTFAAATGRPLVYDPALAIEPATGITLPAGRLIDLPAALAGQGLRARWIAGCLCCCNPPDHPLDRRHPAQRLLLACLPIPGWDPRLDDGLLGELVRGRLLRSTPEWTWETQGSDIMVLPQAGMMLIQADQAQLRATLAVLDSWRHLEEP